MALAIRIEELVRSGEVRDYADLARLGHVSRARVTQIMNFLNLAPDIQEEILFLPFTRTGSDVLSERALRPVVGEIDWKRQRRRWEDVNREALHKEASPEVQLSASSIQFPPVCRD
jgi:hypothetical protein